MDKSDVLAALYRFAREEDNVVAMAAEESAQRRLSNGQVLIDVNGERRARRAIHHAAAARPIQTRGIERAPGTIRLFHVQRNVQSNHCPKTCRSRSKDIGGKLGSTAPDYYLTDYQTLMSNTIDNITDAASGGRLVKVTFDGTNYTLTDKTDNTNTRTIAAAAPQSRHGSYKKFTTR